MSRKFFLYFSFFIFSLAGKVLAQGLGAVPTPPQIAKKYMLSVREFYRAGTLPTKVDLCSQLPPVGNQGAQNSCVAWAVGYYYKSFQEAKEHSWDVSDPLHICSPSFIYNQINGGKDEGSSVYDALSVLAKEGCDNLEDMPYSVQDCLTLPTKDQMLNALNWRIQSFGFFYFYDNDCQAWNCKRNNPLTDAEIEALKAHLANGDVFVMAIPIFTDFYYLDSNNDFYYLPSGSASYTGGHAIVVCGYDDSAGNGLGGFKIRNSWGTYWGNNGEAFISYDFVKNYSWEAVAMVDRIGYQWRIVADLDIDNLYRGDAKIVFSSNGNSFEFMGDYGLGNDLRKGIHVVIDLTDLGVPPTYDLLIGDRNYTSDGVSNTGDLVSLSIKSVWNQQLDFIDVPVSIPDGDSVQLKVPGLGVSIEEFSVEPTAGFCPLTVDFSYAVLSNVGNKLTCSFDFDGDGKTDKEVTGCSKGTVSYTYTKAGDYNATLSVSDGISTAQNCSSGELST